MLGSFILRVQAETLSSGTSWVRSHDIESYFVYQPEIGPAAAYKCMVVISLSLKIVFSYLKTYHQTFTSSFSFFPLKSSFALPSVNSFLSLALPSPFSLSNFLSPLSSLDSPFSSFHTRLSTHKLIPPLSSFPTLSSLDSSLCPLSSLGNSN